MKAKILIIEYSGSDLRTAVKHKIESETGNVLRLIEMIKGRKTFTMLGVNSYSCVKQSRDNFTKYIGTGADMSFEEIEELGGLDTKWLQHKQSLTDEPKMGETLGKLRVLSKFNGDL